MIFLDISKLRAILLYIKSAELGDREARKNRTASAHNSSSRIGI